jgi:NAD(P)-dependent dehydrogenase (short-subunit alcohol dehydrogenase family)
VAFVTGGASGIGAAVVRKFVAEGSSVVIADLQREKGVALARELGTRVRFQEIDVAEEASWELAKQGLLAHEGRLDILVNGAGIGGFGNLEETSVATWRRVMDVNVLSVFLGCRMAVQLMKSGTGGSIVNVSSAMGVRGDALQISYCASKAALLNVTRSVAMHCGRQGYNIRCNAVLPGAVDTPLLRSMESAFESPRALEEAMGALHILHRMGKPEEIADAVLFLASTEASFVTAANFLVDGGMAEMWSGSRVASR